MKKYMVIALALVCILIMGACAMSGESSGKTSVESVITQFKDAGLPIVYQIVFTAENDPNGSEEHAYLKKGNFADSRIEIKYSESEPLSGSVEIFKNKKLAQERADYINSLSSLDEMRYQILKDNVLIRLNDAFTKEQVVEYVNAIEGELYHSPTEWQHENAYAYGDTFIVHAQQVKEGMTLEKAIQIMGFEPYGADSTYSWFDTASANAVTIIVEDGKIKIVNLYLKD